MERCLAWFAMLPHSDSKELSSGSTALDLPKIRWPVEGVTLELLRVAGLAGVRVRVSSAVLAHYDVGIDLSVSEVRKLQKWLLENCGEDLV